MAETSAPKSPFWQTFLLSGPMGQVMVLVTTFLIGIGGTVLTQKYVMAPLPSQTPPAIVQAVAKPVPKGTPEVVVPVQPISLDCEIAKGGFARLETIGTAIVDELKAAKDRDDAREKRRLAAVRKAAKAEAAGLFGATFSGVPSGASK